MTHSAKSIAASLLVSVAFSTPSFAQDVYAVTSLKISNVSNAINMEENTTGKNDVVANPEITAKFVTLFPTATSQKWTPGTDNFWVSFLNNGRKANASFSPKGKMNYMITDCTIEQLPAAFSNAIKNSYTSYQLFNAIEIKAHGAMAWQAIVEDNKGFITLKYTEDGLEEIQQVKKQ